MLAIESMHSCPHKVREVSMITNKHYAFLNKLGFLGMTAAKSKIMCDKPLCVHHAMARNMHRIWILMEYMANSTRASYTAHTGKCPIGSHFPFWYVLHDAI